MATKKDPRTRLKLLPGFCPKCNHATALAIFYAGGMPRQGGAFRLKSQCVSCGAVWDLPKVGSIGYGATKAPAPKRRS